MNQRLFHWSHFKENDDRSATRTCSFQARLAWNAHNGFSQLEIEVTWVAMADKGAVLNALHTLEMPPKGKHVFLEAERAQSIAA